MKASRSRPKTPPAAFRNAFKSALGGKAAGRSSARRAVRLTRRTPWICGHSKMSSRLRVLAVHGQKSEQERTEETEAMENGSLCFLCCLLFNSGPDGSTDLEAPFRRDKSESRDLDSYATLG